MGDLIINTLTQTKSYNTANHLTDFWDLFALSNLGSVETYAKSMYDTFLDIVLTNLRKTVYINGIFKFPCTNKPRSFDNTH